MALAKRPTPLSTFLKCVFNHTLISGNNFRFRWPNFEFELRLSRVFFHTLQSLKQRVSTVYYHIAEFSTLSFDDVTIDDITIAREMFTKRMVTGIVFQRLKISSSISIFDRHILNKFVATVIRKTNILVIFNVFMKYSALISSQNMMLDDEIYNNGGRPYFDFW